jgi:hypothetical protein
LNHLRIWKWDENEGKYVSCDIDEVICDILAGFEVTQFKEDGYLCYGPSEDVTLSLDGLTFLEALGKELSTITWSGLYSVDENGEKRYVPGYPVPTDLS